MAFTTRRSGSNKARRVPRRWRPIFGVVPIVAVTAYTVVERLARACAGLRLARKRLQKRIGMARSRERERDYSDDPIGCFQVWLPESVAATYEADVQVPEGVNRNTLMLDRRQYRELVAAAISRALIKLALPKILCGAPRPFDPKRSRVRTKLEKQDRATRRNAGR